MPDSAAPSLTRLTAGQRGSRRKAFPAHNAGTP